MKTSNLILLGFLITIFAIPLLLIASLNNKINNKQFTVVKNDYEATAPIIRKGSIENFSVIKFEGPDPDYLECRLVQSDTAGYAYEKFNDQDSIAVFMSNDTLVIHYVSPSGKSEHEDYLAKKNGQEKIRVGNRLKITLNLNSLQSAIIDGASVYIDSLDTKAGIKLILKNRGTISDAKEEKQRDNVSVDTKRNNNPAELNAVAKLDPEKQIIEVAANLRSAINTEMKDLLVFHLM